MKKIILLFLCLFLAATVLSAQTKGVELRLVVSEGESKKIENEQYLYVRREGEEAKNLLLNKEVILSSKDIRNINIIRKGDGKKGLPAIDIAFNEKAAEKLKRITSDNIRKQMAVLVNDEILSAPYILSPIVTGHVRISSWKLATNNEARDFVKKLGYNPKFVGGSSN